ncbi:hypothetical protein O7602_26660 [Micromonospora sp. WMMD1128]|uniref:hypothetical protein n=1 Tax=Micromonospora sp. WMMD1128 TaxID=3015150 RepID=UPI00248D38D1|nr:hypothetical protein [Micromonospora sp. WMMD1128]WBB73226.1 hypothetical protein O7602_26660 [Micromonospora sp. WMMD1128]
MAYQLLANGDVPSATYFNSLMQQGNIVCTSGSRPSSPVEGMTIVETDTELIRVWSGSAWVVIGYTQPQFAYKTGDQQVTNSTTKANDADLVLPVQANAVYAVEGTILYQGFAANDVGVDFTFPSGTMSWGISSLAPSVTTYTGEASGAGISAGASGSGFVLGAAGLSNTLLALIKGTLSTGGSAGSLQFRFAQQSAAASTSAIIKTGSSLWLRRVA